MSRYLFATLPSNDFGLLTQSLPIAHELKLMGQEVNFCHPAKRPQILIREAGLENLLHDDPLYRLSSESLLRLLKRGKPLRTLKVLARMMMGMRNFQRLASEIRNADDFNALLFNNSDFGLFLIVCSLFFPLLWPTRFGFFPAESAFYSILPTAIELQMISL